MFDLSIETLKQVNLVEFLSQYYGLEFQRWGVAYACRSPFTQESKPSFFVRLVGGRWLFKDFSSGAGGTIFDFIWLKEKLADFSEALSYLQRLFQGGLAVSHMVQEENAGEENATPMGDRSYDVERLFQRFRKEDPHVCREYLVGRGILPKLVDTLIRDQIVVHNRHEGRSWCCFVVRDEAGNLKCLDNHAVEGDGKFVLGSKSIFTCEWEALKTSKIVFVAEGIIDYLSVKTLELDPPPGFALLGNQLIFESSLLEHAKEIVSALDTDDGGVGALFDLREMYPGKPVTIYNLENYKDPNEMLMAIRESKGRDLSPERKLQLFREFQKDGSKTELAQRWGIDRSYLYEIVRECDEMVVQGFSGRKRGRPPKGEPRSLEEALERIKDLERKYEQEATEREKLYCRSEFLQLRLKWAEIEAAELKGESVDENQGPKKKPQMKKKGRRKRR